jgi:hypothetical protein
LGASTDPGDSALKTKHPVVRTLPEIVAAVKAKIHGSGAAASITEGIA